MEIKNKKALKKYQISSSTKKYGIKHLNFENLKHYFVSLLVNKQYIKGDQSNILNFAKFVMLTSLTHLSITFNSVEIIKKGTFG